MKTIFHTALLLVAACSLAACGGDKNAQEYNTVTLSKGSLSTTITATGTIEPINQVSVGAQVSGIISKIYVDYNSEVKSGQLLAQIDTSLMAAELRSSEASLASAKAEYEYQEKNFARQKSLWEKKLISDTEYESAKYNYDRALSSYNKSQADIVKARKNLGYCYIYSTVDGVVMSRAVEEGQTVASSFNTPELFIIANDLRKMRVIADVDEAEIGEVKEGQRAVFTVDAFPNDTFEGEVTQVRINPTTESNVVTYEVVVDAPNPDLKLLPGLTANVTIYTLDKQDVLSVPVRAFRFNPSGAVAVGQSTSNHKTLWLKEKNGKLKQVNVTTGVSDGISTEVTSGVKEGDEVVVSVRVKREPEMSSSGQEETNPFMPTPPGGDRNKNNNKK